jgi:hypothetical protein
MSYPRVYGYEQYTPAPAIPDGYRILPNNIPTGRKFIPYPSLYRVISAGYSDFGYPLPSLDQDDVERAGVG